MEMKFTAIVPLYTDVDMKKNFLLINNKPLFLYIFETLMQTPMIDEIICYCSNEMIKDFLPKGIKFLKRNKLLDQDDVNSFDILKNLENEIETDYFILCSVTSPFIKSSSIVKGIEVILEEKEYDSVFSVAKHQTYAWFLDVPLNYSLEARKRTNKIEPFYSETKGFYIFEKSLMSKFGRNIGFKSKKIEVSQIEAINVKKESDLELAQIVAKAINYNYTTPYFLLSKICTHLILDMDGVIIDSVDLMELSWEYSGGISHAPFSEYKKLIGLPFNDICLKLGIDVQEIPAIKEKYFTFSKQNIKKTKIYPEVKETIDFLRNKGVKVSIVTSKSYNSAKNIIQYFDLNIDCLIAPDMPHYIGRNKPFGDPLLAACLNNKIEPYHSIFVGDMLSDYQSAKEANIDFIFADYGYGKLEITTNKIEKFASLKLLSI
ncbi:HAD-IA family hydrolase [Campylobacter jejuni]|nr:HAD-IA family hydrolase [Campylobacter jejuni]ECQ7461241.1 HAD-IA family hydrolase [Campylobacter jejuni]ECQ9162217.1 HAD-IA family hydrolase [Campylobacter jejuni]EDP4524844.1 HAD-IA family hydrolase [Campylobacter jejuni]